MIKRKLGKILLSRRGMTLAEIIAAFAIVAMCTALLVTVFGTTVNLVKLGKTLSGNGGTAFSMIESGNSSTSSGQLTFSANGVTFTVNGTYRSSTNGDGNAVTYTEFDTAG